MKIVNPIYDNAFKYLMDNEEIAKMVLSIILDTRVISLQSKPQETPFAFQGNINVSRFDFKAVIRNEAEEDKTVLIEIQKYRSNNPIGRFRNYLAQNYMKKEMVAKNKEQETKYLPVITVYILGFDLSEFDCRAIRIDNRPFDIVQQEELSVKSSFVELLTHQSFILLAGKKDVKVNNNTKLEKFLNLFIQKLQGEAENTIIDISTEAEADSELKSIITHLNKATLDEELVRRVNAEQEHEKGIANLEKEIQEIREREEQAKAREEEAKAREEEAKAREEEAKAREEKERRQKKQTQIKLAKQMRKYNEPIEEIIKETGLSREEIEKLN